MKLTQRPKRVGMLRLTMWILTAFTVLVVLVIAGGLAWVLFVNNVEQPTYTIVRSDGAIEVRDYPKLVVAEVVRPGERNAAVNAGFSPLARYIFARERAGDSIAMTAPVTQSKSEKNSMTAPVTQQATGGEGRNTEWTVRFIMPSQYALADLPIPAAGDVQLREIAAQRVAAIRFSGVATDQLLARKEADCARGSQQMD